MYKILLYGRSLWFGGLEAYLQGVQGLQVVQADQLSLETSADLVDFCAVILDSAQDTDALALLRIHPAAVMMSLNATTGELTILSGQLHQVHTMQDIVHLLQSIAAAYPSRTCDRPSAPEDSGA